METYQRIKGKVIYHSFPNTGVSDGKAVVKYFDIEKREEKTILDDVNRYWLTADGKKMLVRRGVTWAVIKPEENQNLKKTIRTGEMTMMVDPAKEWKQLFMDTWRMERDYFYDAGMHAVDWNLVKERYLKMLDGATCREEVNFVFG
jgi:tricorn protease